jgi:hypothetical protein
LNPANSASESRRKWFNQITAVADAWADPNDVKIASCADRLVDGDEIVLFGDGSKSDDATGLVACRVSDGLCQVLHVQQPKAGTIVDRNAVDLAVSDAFRRFKVVAFYFDPSHVKDDDAEGDNRFWWPLCDEWMARFGKRLKMWPVQSGPKRHAVVFDMSVPSNLAQFEPAAEHALGDLTSHTLRFAESTWLTTHMINARESPGRYGMSVRKEHRESRHKIDLAVCLIGARMMWRSWHLSQISKRTGVPGQGRVIALS